MRSLSTKWKITIAFASGIAAVLIFMVIQGNSLEANISEETITKRIESATKAQEKEITRLRGMVQNDETKKTCTTHNDCPSIETVCKEGFCETLKKATCECKKGVSGEYILCTNEAKNEARTVPCGQKTCLSKPTARCES